MTNYQAEIAANVAARGYREGWTDEQYAARQVCKLGEELGELVIHLRTPISLPYWAAVAYDRIGFQAREHFDNTLAWDDASLWDHTAAAAEAADMLVVLYNLADALGVDLNALALEKSKSDVERGVR